MIYANENRKKMAHSYPQESNKEISKRLGISWKALDFVEKKKYFELAKNVDVEHKRKYPGKKDLLIHFKLIKIKLELKKILLTFFVTPK